MDLSNLVLDKKKGTKPNNKTHANTKDLAPLAPLDSIESSSSALDLHKSKNILEQDFSSLKLDSASKSSTNSTSIESSANISSNHPLKTQQKGSSETFIQTNQLEKNFLLNFKNSQAKDFVTKEKSTQVTSPTKYTQDSWLDSSHLKLNLDNTTRDSEQILNFSQNLEFGANGIDQDSEEQNVSSSTISIKKPKIPLKARISSIKDFFIYNRQLLFYCLCTGIMGGYFLYVVFGNISLWTLRGLNKKQDALTEDIERLQKENARMQKEIFELKELK